MGETRSAWANRNRNGERHRRQNGLQGAFYHWCRTDTSFPSTIQRHRVHHACGIVAVALSGSIQLLKTDLPRYIYSPFQCVKCNTVISKAGYIFAHPYCTSDSIPWPLCGSYDWLPCLGQFQDNIKALCSLQTSATWLWVPGISLRQTKTCLSSIVMCICCIIWQ